MANPNVFQQLIQPIRSVVDYSADLDRQEMGRLALEGGRRQNALAALTEQQTRAQIEDSVARRNALQRVYSTLPANADPITRARALQADPLTAEQGIAAEKGVIENDKGRASAAKDQAEADAKRAEARYKAADRHAQNLSFVQTPQDIVAYIDEGIQMGLMPPESRQRAVEKAMQMGVPAWKQAAAQGAVAVLDQFKIDAENKRAQLAADTTTRGQNLTAETARRGQNMTDARSREANSTQRELLIQEKGLKVAELQDKASERARAKDANAASIQSQIAVIDKALNHPGRKTSTGLSGTLDPRNYVPGTDATDFRAVLDQIGGSAFLQAFESLKGGGAITEVEGKKATDAIARLSRAQSDGEFEVALRDLRKVMADGYSRLGRGAPAQQAAPSGGGKVMRFDAQGNPVN